MFRNKKNQKTRFSDGKNCQRKKKTGSAPGIAVLAPSPGQPPSGAHPRPTKHLHTCDLSTDFVKHLSEIIETLRQEELHHTSFSSSCAYVSMNSCVFVLPACSFRAAQILKRATLNPCPLKQRFSQ